jgi:NAD(P)-dependent dehydrogenase (short-subunit alcohol dehydrogenase family)
MHHLFGLSGKTAFITGASSGLGERFARCLSSAGARVILAARRVDKLKDLASELNNALALSINVAEQASILEAFNQLEEAGERVDICINNAGIAQWTPLFLDELDTYDAFDKGAIETWDEVMAVNLRGTWLVTQSAAMHMKRHKIPGSIINVASTLGDRRPVAGASAASVSKAGIIHLTKQLVPELSRYNIRINSIIPGMFWSDLTAEQLTKRGDDIKSKIPLGFIGQVQDFEGAVLFLASHKASGYMTGASLTLDGGASCGGSSCLS